jgi:fructose-1,6-bisphosphatase-3
MRIVSHQPFAGRQDAIENNHDIDRDSEIFEWMEHRLKVSETDVGRVLQTQADDLMMLLQAYRTGAVAENHRK